MGYFDAILSAGQVEEEDGRVRFHPYGIFGAGYRIGKEEAERVRSFLASYYLVSFPLAFFGIQSSDWVGWPIAIGLVAVVFVTTSIWYATRMKALLVGAERTETRLTWGENARMMAERGGLRKTVLWVALTASMVAMSTFLLLSARGDKVWIGVSGIFVFGLMLGMSLYQLAHLLRNRGKQA